MRALSSYILVFVIAWAALYKSVVFVGFKLNQYQVITENCVQRNAEVNYCLGSCYLKEKLALDSNKEKPQDTPLLIEFQDLIFVDSQAITLKNSFKTQRQSYTFITSNPLSGFLKESWRPPWLV